MTDPSPFETKTLGLVPEFYFDLIGRITPGVLVVALYDPGQLWRIDNLAAVGLVVFSAYFLDILLDIVSERVFHHCVYRQLPRLAKKHSYFSLCDDATLWSWARSLATNEQTVVKKKMAEKALFRIATLVAATSLFWPPPVLLRCDRRSLVSLAATLLFLYCTMTMQRWLSDLKREYEERSRKH